MATIGTFTASDNGFSGTIKTLNLNVKARIARVESPSDKGPDFRIFAGNVEFGAGLAEDRLAKANATTSRSSSTTRASPLRSTPH